MEQSKFEQGTLQPKYHTSNPIYRRIVDNFNNTISDKLIEVRNTDDQIKNILEIGVGEGQITELCLSVFGQEASYVCSDIAPGILSVAKSNLSWKIKKIQFSIEDLTDMSFDDNSFDLVICCETLEHVPEFHKGLKELYRIVKPNKYLLVSVPNEPIWRISNVIRGYYLKDFGNTPGHVNNWTFGQIRNKFLKLGFVLKSKSKPMPWSVLLLQKPK